MDLKNNEQIIPFLYEYFKAHHCDIIVANNKELTVQLTVELDKTLMNRPFYWHYIESTNRIGTPHRIAFSTEIKDDPQIEWVHFGSPRLQQIFEQMNKENKYIQLFENFSTTEATILEPWLLTNNLIIYEGKQKKEQIVSIGLNLVNGTMMFNIMESLHTVHLSPTISSYCYTISPLISLNNGFKRIEKEIYHIIDQESLEWAERSHQLMNEEKAMAKHFYGTETQEDQLLKELTDIETRLQPTITHHVINGGMLYLSKNFLKNRKA